MRSGLLSRPHWGSLQRSPNLVAGERAPPQEALLRSRHSASNFGPLDLRSAPRPIPGYAYAVCLTEWPFLLFNNAKVSVGRPDQSSNLWRTCWLTCGGYCCLWLRLIPGIEKCSRAVGGLRRSNKWRMRNEGRAQESSARHLVTGDDNSERRT